MIKKSALGLLLAATSVGLVLAQAQGRIAGKVEDLDGVPIEGVTITLQATGFDLQIQQTTNKKGKFTIMVVDSTKDYTVTLEKEGFRTLTEPVDIPLQGIANATFVLGPDESAGSAAPAPSTGAPVDTSGKPTSTNRSAISAFNDGVAAVQAKEYDTALEKFHKAVEHDPLFSEAWVILGGLYQERQDWPSALNAADQALAADATDAGALTIRFDALHSQGMREESLEVVEQLMATDRSPQTAARVYNAAVAAAQAGDGTTAIDLFEKSVEIDPQLAPAHRVLADSYFKSGNLEAAKLHVDHLYEVAPTNAAGLTLRYEIYHALGDEETARQALDALESASPEALADTYLTQGVEMFESGDTPAALELFERAVAANPNHPRVNFRLGMAYASSGQNDKAKQHLQRFIELAPDDPEAATATEMLSYL